jgi:hypothetical protein
MDSHTTDDQPVEPAKAERPGVSRRTFLRGTTLTAAAVGVAASVPGLSGLLASGTASAPAVEESLIGADGETASLSEPLVAHIKDVATGEISLFHGEQEVVIRDPSLARRLATSARP